jgi:hypothetical protein
VSRYNDFTDEVILCLNAALYLGYDLTPDPAKMLAERVLELQQRVTRLENQDDVDRRDFVGHYPSPPAPVFGMASESHHGIAIGLAKRVLVDVLLAAYCGQVDGLPLERIPADKSDLSERIEDNWQAVSEALRRIPREEVNLAKMHVDLGDESVRAERAAGARRDAADDAENTAGGPSSLPFDTTSLGSVRGKAEIMADRDSLLKYRDAALRCNKAAQNVLAAFWARPSGLYTDGVGNILGALPASAFPNEEAKTAFQISWTEELEKAVDEWQAAAYLTKLANGDRVFEAVERAVGLEATPVVVGRFSVLTAHQAAGCYAGVVRDRLRGEKVEFPIVADLHAQIRKESIQAVKTLSAANGDETPTEAPAPDIENNPARYLFQRDGAYYRVQFDGETGTLPDLVGVQYLHKLLQRPNVSVKATELRGDVEVSPEIVEDKERLQGCHDQLQQIAAGLERARNENNLGEVDRLERDKQAVLDEVNRLTGIGGRARLTNPNDTARVAVTQAIERVRDGCRTRWNMRRFANHLEQYVDTGSDCTYRPVPAAPDWQF